MIEINNLETKLDKDGFIVSDIKGVSMLPLLKQGKDRVILSKINKPLNKYDVVLYKVNNKYILHRIIDINNDDYVIRGDNCINKEIINKTNILGILIAFYRKDEYIEVTEEMNKKCYFSSNNSILFRRIKAKIRRMLFNKDE